MKLILGVIFSLSLVSGVHACDICGGASNSLTVGMLANSKQHFISLRSSARWFKSYPSPDGDGFRDISQQRFISNELFGRWRLNRRIQLMGFIPFVTNTMKDSVRTTFTGLGDMTILTNFVLFDSSDSLSTKMRQIGSLGFGVKAPTGKYFELGLDELNMLPGSGSWDFIANLNYSVQGRRYGLQLESSYTFKTANKFAYRFGNALSSSLVVFRKMNLKKNSAFIPQVGFSYFHNDEDLKGGELSEDTYNGGNQLNAQLNLNFIIQKVGVFCQTSIPIYQNLNRDLVKQELYLRLGFSYFITNRTK